MKNTILKLLLTTSFLVLVGCEKQEAPAAPPPAPSKNTDALSHFKAVPLPPKDTYKNPKF